MKYYPKFDQRLNSHLENQRMQQSRTRLGTVMSYDKMTNTVTVVMDDKLANTARKYSQGSSMPRGTGRANGCANRRFSLYNRL